MANITVTCKLETLADWEYENISKLLKTEYNQDWKT